MPTTHPAIYLRIAKSCSRADGKHAEVHRATRSGKPPCRGNICSTASIVARTYGNGAICWSTTDVPSGDSGSRRPIPEPHQQSTVDRDEASANQCHASNGNGFDLLTEYQMPKDQCTDRQQEGDQQ